MSEYTAIVKRDGNWWIDWIEEVHGVQLLGALTRAVLETLRITWTKRSKPTAPTLARRLPKTSREVRRMKPCALKRWLYVPNGCAFDPRRRRSGSSFAESPLDNPSPRKTRDETRSKVLS
jgi:hypothetical protein